MTEYFVTAAVWSAIGLIIGYILGLGHRIGFVPAKLSREKRERVVGMGLILLALLSTAQSLYFQRTQREITHCQTHYNQVFQKILQERAVLADKDRDNVSRMASGVINARNDNEVRTAIQQYIEEARRITNARGDVKFPRPPKDVCKERN